METIQSKKFSISVIALFDYNFLDRNKMFYMFKLSLFKSKYAVMFCAALLRGASQLPVRLCLQQTVGVLVLENFLNGLSNTVLLTSINYGILW